MQSGGEAAQDGPVITGQVIGSLVGDNVIGAMVGDIVGVGVLLSTFSTQHPSSHTGNKLPHLKSQSSSERHQ